MLFLHGTGTELDSTTSANIVYPIGFDGRNWSIIDPDGGVVFEKQEDCFLIHTAKQYWLKCSVSDVFTTEEEAKKACEARNQVEEIMKGRDVWIIKARKIGFPEETFIAAVRSSQMEVAKFLIEKSRAAHFKEGAWVWVIMQWEIDGPLDQPIRVYETPIYEISEQDSGDFGSDQEPSEDEALEIGEDL